jgi:hypothetical protein
MIECYARTCMYFTMANDRSWRLVFARVTDRPPLIIASNDPTEAEYLASEYGAQTLTSHLCPLGVMSIVHTDNSV